MLSELFDNARHNKAKLPNFNIDEVWYQKETDLISMNYSGVLLSRFWQSFYDAKDVKNCNEGF